MAAVPGCSVDLASVESNMVYVDVAGTGLDADAFAAGLLESGIWTHATGPTSLRFVTHLQVDVGGIVFNRRSKDFIDFNFFTGLKSRLCPLKDFHASNPLIRSTDLECDSSMRIREKGLTRRALATPVRHRQVVSKRTGTPRSAMYCFVSSIVYSPK